jgi:hypothetical protein
MRVAFFSNWEPLADAVPFPSAQAHLDACSQLNLRASNPSAWSTQYRRQLRQDFERRLGARRVAT